MSAKSDLYREVLNDYERLRDASAAKLRQRKAQVFETEPEIEETENEISLFGVKMIKAAAQNPADKDAIIKQLKTQLAELKTTRIELLKRSGFAEDYLEPVYACPDCRDTGYVGDKMCRCMKQRLVEKAYGFSNLKETLKTENFDFFSFDYYSDTINTHEGTSPRDNIKTIFGICVDFVNNFGSRFDNILLYGKSGLGKTFLCNCIAKELLDKGHTVLYITASKLFKMFEDARFNKDEESEPDKIIEDVLSVDLLIIDDLGTEFSTILSSSELFNIVNSRLLEKKPVIISTNLEPKDLVDMYSDRIVSRITGGYTVLSLFGEDIRKIKKFKQFN